MIDILGVDPEGGAIRYSISGPIFTVDRETGVVRLQQQLDREKQDLVEVIISITGISVCIVHGNLYTTDILWIIIQYKSKCLLETGFGHRFTFIICI